MICKEAEMQMTKFVNHELNLKERSEFIEHIKNCDSCKENLEIHYTLYTGIKLLDSDEEVSSNFKLDFESMLKKTEEAIRIKKIRRIQKKIAIFIVVLLLSIFL